ncbi:MAG: hypothetical protein ABI550_10125 [Ignavibacteriaceae bacterium]
MMKHNYSIFLMFIFFTPVLFAQSKIEDDINAAYQNAKKGIYWGLSNIPEKKSKMDDDLIFEDKFYASVKLEKVIDGIKVESTGFNNSNEVKITIYKSNDNLLKEGYLKPKKDANEEKKK